LRALADIDREPTTAVLLRSVAESYDTMAFSLDGIERENQKARK
jgi:hypothetical protein